ncbi:hypothetical protein CRE_08962 [Caenorhabditis remanei]|uniref:G-protein coupled receptors family 1 profile domain-containing protein n=1 Tax=Caenorhabditis remanei TaxID=31234 RepID=E3LIH7_CAERE|nr:hypothetical protein CRE_08962 [Caenorhabditis remanei]
MSEDCTFYTNLQNTVSFLLGFEIHIAIFSFSINLFHIIVLTRACMRTSSINLIMAAATVSDMYSQFYIIEQKIKSHYENLETCFSGTSYLNVLVDILLKLLKDVSRRSSTWLNFSIALIRTLVIRNPMNPKFEKLSNPKTAFYFVLFILIFNVSISTFGSFQFIILSEKATNDCDRKPKKVVTYRFDFSEFFMGNDLMVYKVYNSFDAFLSKFIPSILFPIATIFLIWELRKNEKNRIKISSSNAYNSSGKTTKLVLFLTITFFIAEFPLALITALEPYYSDAYGLLLLLNYFNYLFTIILSANTSTHMTICLLLSSQYREAAKSVLLCGYLSKVPNKKTIRI